MIAQHTHRTDRINQLIWRELVLLIYREVKDPRLQKVSITEVITTRDLTSSKVFFNSAAEDKELIEKLLTGASGFLRSRLAKNLKLRHTPQLQFRYDHAQNTGNSIEVLIAKL